MNFATAQARYDGALPPDDPAYSADPESIIDEMVAEPDCFDAWLSNRPCPQSVAGLLSLILDRGLPSNNGSECDDELCDIYETRVRCVRDDFAAWASQPDRFKPAPVDAWRSE